ncbi:MAG: hypothetical protein WCY51_03150 [Sulfurimonas sp.]|nr:hypothetical protein [Sulfurimonas sp.]
MADDQEKTEEYIILNEKETRLFFYAKAAVATKVKSFSRFCALF